MRKLSVNTGGMSRQSKSAPQAKKVMPPAVPDVYGRTGAITQPGGSVEENGGFIIQQQETPSTLMLRYDHTDFADDQGIDLTQSPGRDSPISLSGSAGSGSRHSTASLDSGRASSYLTGASTSSNRSAGGYGTLSSPRCSVSSCSIGSGNRLSNHSNRSDHDIISEWLNEVHFHEYTYLFLEAGYDLPTIARMTPEDLTAIGIKQPNHRERLKRHIDALKLPDALPNYVPGSIEEWLRLLRLEEYVAPLLAQGYVTVNDVTQLTWEDLEDIGIVKLGHQKKILLAIKRVKDIISGKLGGPYVGPGVPLPQPTTAALHCQPIRAQFDESLEHKQLTYSTFMRQPAPGTDPYYCQQHLQQQQQISYPHVHFDGNQAIYRRSSYDDSDITPTNEMSSMMSNDHHGAINSHQQYYQGGGTLPRQHQRNSYGVRLTLCQNPPSTATTQRQRPIAKIVANNLKLAPTSDGGPAPPYPNPMIGQIENVEMATAALDAMHFSNYSSFNHHPLKYNPATATQPPQPIYHNQIILQQQAQLQQQQQTQQFYSNYAGQTHQTTVEIHKTQHDNKSNSSLESIDQIPFANENAGTIKQRSMNRTDHHPMHMLSHSSSSTSSSSSTGSITTTLAGCIQQLSPPQQPGTEQPPGAATANNCSKSSSSGSSGPGLAGVAAAAGKSASASASCTTSPTTATAAQIGMVGTNVLNDIGNMLANLTDELDAMLEEENRAGISDIE
ncbi:uncharacterized protein LOC129757344 [Uranotaenia lowii]|uniref:uncharacterized protein LOC129757344 n=1 Tax=Uranotaenia lowii TaxID=190385 RepID=UPI00247A4F6E|nr:uncharacterized protein LOC129757344 [Uranotaenia lowii]